MKDIQETNGVHTTGHGLGSHCLNIFVACTVVVNQFIEYHSH